MNTYLYPLAFGLAVLVGGCSRQEPTQPAAAAPPPTTVGTAIDDTVVTAKVKSALLTDPEIKGFDIKVETRKGVAQLTGFVDNPTQIDRVIAAARAVDGVKSVENGMTLKDGKATVGNTMIASTITPASKLAPGGCMRLMAGTRTMRPHSP